MYCVCVCVFVGQTVGIIGLTAPPVKGTAESTGVCSWRAPLVPSPSSSTSSFLFSSSLPPPSAVILIRRERPAKELQLVVAGHFPPVGIEIRRQMRDFKYACTYFLKCKVYLRCIFPNHGLENIKRLLLQQKQHYIYG